MNEREEWMTLIRNEYDPAPAHYHMGEDWDDGAGRIADAILADKILAGRQLWRLIETSPRDGTHIIVATASNPDLPPTTVHWAEGGWHLSVNQMGEYSEYVWGPPTHWMPTTPLPRFASSSGLPDDRLVSTRTLGCGEP